ncbi:RNA polymerase sigma-70 factor, ECF subfamily [Chitinophaga terrae (ex Kim and Jung 2007)]|uniref:RNA polymerase sigma-70 factor, ECF subfamily n=1 Tax=Chitinophaga terrae (ex Kim and Jung 2007) TaxID=408074 RepID=A0A1H3WTN4_9BACT|nr:sigma-70 family RNA polymerase sigma factor [Chitinophaga terrae (ex Kim and Jung 2007)]GEP90318.1 DNA-directed RNA polymerase sigma-70 factor [Chitinophaga terrae (ex Kim and Jung 2007)]SDZ90527.1 RNA polymerase sigma-70 factor, ECF subfamily [Chitinophaga terrae (ex Kim and Jung 2007)]
MEDLLAAIRSGNHSALEQLYDAWHGRLYGYFYKKTSSKYLSEELVQIAFIKLWNSRRLLSDDWPLEVQLLRIMKTSLIDVLRKELRDAKAFQEYNRHVVHTNEDQQQEAITNDQLQIVEKVMEAMPPVRKKVFHLSRYKGLSHKQIALELAISPKTVENHITQALKQLRHLLK